MGNDEARRVLSSLLAGVIARGAPARPAEELIAGLLSRAATDPANRRAEDAGEAKGRTSSENETSRSLEGPMAQLAQRLAELAVVSRLQADTVEANTRAVIENSLAKAGESKASTAGGVARSVLGFLGSGLGLVRLVGKLFGGEEKPKETVLTRYVAPPPIEWTAALSGGRLQPVDYGQGLLPRTVAPVAPAAPPITIQVQAIDSRSFLDHSAEIARAVKEALLNTHTLADVVADL